MTELQQFITDFQAHAMLHGSKHHVTGLHMSKGWHSDTIIQACVAKFGDDVAKDAKAFMVQQMVDSDKPETYRVEQQVDDLDNQYYSEGEIL